MYRSLCGIFGILHFSLCLILALAEHEDFTVGRPVGPARQGRAAKVTCVAGDFGPKCADCSTQLSCLNNIVLAENTCSSINSAKPYCVDNLCTSNANSDNCVVGGFRCTSSGIFPDPNNCRRYFLCDSTNGNAYSYECPQYYVFDSKTGLCKRSLFCPTIDCSRTPNQYIIFAANPAYMAFCLSNSQGKETILFRCPDNRNMQFDSTTLQCVFNCPYEGRFADKLDCHSFYECYRNALKLQYNHQTCPRGYAYDQVAQVCVRKAACTNEIPSESDGGDEGSGGGASLFIF